MLKPTVFLARSTLRTAHSVPGRIPILPTLPTFPTLQLGTDGRLWVGSGAEARAVAVRRCFPWSEPDRFISLRDEENREVVLVRDPAELDRESRQALETALAAAGFVLTVTKVISVEEEIEIRHWQVETAQGPRSFQTRLDDWPRTLPGGGVLIRDVAGDLYHVAAPEGLDHRSRELLWAFVD
ncbi:MAG TPA: DUF1854 domain-containing protein [Gemmatimonadales bacterium]